MNDLFEAIFARFNATPVGDTLRILAPGGMFHGRAPQTATYPLIELTMPGTSTEVTMDSDFDLVLVDYHCWDNQRSPLRVELLANEVKVVYADVKLTVTGFSNIRSDKISEVELEDPDGDGYQYVVTFQYTLGF